MPSEITRVQIVASALCRAAGMDPDGGRRCGYGWRNHREDAVALLARLDGSSATTTMSNPDTHAVVTVTQEDREAAWPVRSWLITDTVATCRSWNAGNYDDTPLVQAFARHRIAAEARVSAREEVLQEALDRAVQIADQAGFHWPADPYEGIK